MSRKAKEENYEPTYEERRKAARRAALVKLSPALKELAKVAEVMTKATDLGHVEEHHVCHPPEVPHEEANRLDKHPIDQTKSWSCTCGLSWEWRSTRRTWHPVK